MSEEPAVPSPVAEEKPEPQVEEEKAVEAVEDEEQEDKNDEEAETGGEVADAGVADAEASPKQQKSRQDWGAWGNLPEGFDSPPPEGEEKPSLPLLDELAVEKIDDKTELVEGIVGPDGYEYPPLTKNGAEVLRRLWDGELPPNREQAVKLWEGRVRVSSSMGLATPVAPRVPPKELLERKAAVKTTSTDKDISKWVLPEDEEESAEVKEWRENGERVVPETVTRMLERRHEARLRRDFREADAIRDSLNIMGVEFNDIMKQWRCGEVQGSFSGGDSSPSGSSSPHPTDARPPIELQDIDLPGSWQEFLALPDPKVLAVGPRGPPNGRRAWGAGGFNWGVRDEAQAVDQAMNNCAQQGVHRPKIIWPPHLAGSPAGSGFGGKGGGGFGQGYGKGGGKYGGKGQRYSSYNNY